MLKPLKGLGQVIGRPARGLLSLVGAYDLSGDANVTAPSGCIAFIYAWGGGGSGAAYSSTSAGGGGGGAAGYSRIRLGPGSTLAVTVGYGGPGKSNGNDGSSGTQSTVILPNGRVMSAGGGGGGTVALGGAGGVAFGFDLNRSGGAGGGSGGAGNPGDHGGLGGLAGGSGGGGGGSAGFSDQAGLLRRGNAGGNSNSALVPGYGAGSGGWGAASAATGSGGIGRVLILLVRASV